MKKKYIAVDEAGHFWVDCQWRNSKKENVSELYCSTISMEHAKKIARALNRLEKQKNEKKVRKIKEKITGQAGVKLK